MTHTPDVLTDCTADFAIILILSACRRAPEYQAVMNQGWGWRIGQNQLLGIQVTGKSLGILGMGRIGRAVASRARSFGMKILYSNPRQLPSELEQGAIYFKSFKEMLPHCQVLSLHAPANQSTSKIMDAECFSLLPKGAVFVNTARGSLVDEDALIQSLQSEHLFAAGLDVFQNEPHFNQKFLEFKNLVLAPHMGSATVETRTAMGLRALDNVIAVKAGRRPLDLLFHLN
jgi:hydroxypyruvate reductase